MSEYRLIVTGSREYDDAMALQAALDKVLGSMRADELVLIHGEQERLGFPSAPDQIAARWAQARIAEGLPVIEEVYPAAWTGECVPRCTHGERVTWRGISICPQAGEHANAQMVAAGPDQGLAALLIGSDSRRAKDCLIRMHRAGIPFEISVKGSAQGLPEGLIGRNG